MRAEAGIITLLDGFTVLFRRSAHKEIVFDKTVQKVNQFGAWIAKFGS